MDEYLEVRLAEHSALRRLVTVHTRGEQIGELWYEALPPVVRPFSGTSLDFAAIALLPYVTRQHKYLYLVGSVTRSLVANLEEYQDVWVRWRPDLFTRITVMAETLRDWRSSTGNARGSVLAYSGGPDSTYALIANSTIALAIVHGFDIPLQDEATFAAASAKVARLGEAFGVPLQRVRTNWREWSPQWVLTFGSGLSSVLQQFPATMTQR